MSYLLLCFWLLLLLRVLVGISVFLWTFFNKNRLVFCFNYTHKSFYLIECRFLNFIFVELRQVIQQEFNVFHSFLYERVDLQFVSWIVSAVYEGKNTWDHPKVSLGEWAVMRTDYWSGIRKEIFRYSYFARSSESINKDSTWKHLPAERLM